MKKLVVIAVAIALVASIVAGFAVHATSTSSNGVPAQKTSLASNSVDLAQFPNTGGLVWVDDPDLSNIQIHTANNPKAALIISYTGEADLVTDVQIQGNNSKQTSTSWAGVKVRAIIDGTVVADPGDVVLNYRYMQLTGLLWGNNGTTFIGLPTQYIDIYEHTRSANGFNWYVLVPGGGTTHTIKIQYAFDYGQSGVAANSNAGVIIGKRSAIVELDNVN